MNRTESPILVAGGRTTGLTMACELARHGVPVRIIDKSPGIDPHCRATGIHSRTLEIFQDLGVVDTVLEQGVPVMGGRQYANGELCLHVRYVDVDSPYRCAISLEQNRTEEILERLLESFGIQVERETELLDFTSNDDSVSATIRRPDGTEETVETPWLIGCDGAHSRVRHVGGFTFPGKEDLHQYVLADVRIDGPIVRDEWYSFLTDRGTLYFFVLPGPRTFAVADISEHHDSTTEAPTLDEIQKLIAERGPSDLRVGDPRWLAYFRIHYRVARHYRKGRTFMAGDAVHVHSPVGGLGMNTGIQDAYNLAWKLALVMRGEAPESLLDSYEIERRQVAEDVVRTTKNATDRAELFSHLSPSERERLYFHIVIPEAERLAAARHREELDLDYRKSHISVEAGTGTPGAGGFRSGPQAGAEALDAGPLKVAGQSRTLFELLKGTKLSLLLFSGTGRAGSASDSVTSLAADIANEYGHLMNVFIVCDGAECPENPPPGTEIVCDPERSLYGRYGVAAGCLYLIRPDGYVAYRDRQANRDLLQRYMKRVFGDRAKCHVKTAR